MAARSRRHASASVGFVFEAGHRPGVAGLDFEAVVTNSSSCLWSIRGWGDGFGSSAQPLVKGHGFRVRRVLSAEV